MLQAQQFAELAGVTVRTLHHYDRLGLLRARRTEAGYRVYRESDLERLEQIVALKFVGLPLKRIKTLLDRDNLGKFQEGADRQVLQSIKAKDAYGAAAYWNGYVFFTDRSYVTRAFAIRNGLLVATGMTARMSSPGATPIVSADRTKDAILWVVSTKEWDEAHKDRPAVLHAYDARDITHELYNSEQKSERDRADMTVRFAIPTIADGHIFVGARGRLDVYGLLNRGSRSQK